MALFGQGIGKHPAHQDAAGRGVILVVDEVDRPLVWKAILALERHGDRNSRVLVGELDLALVNGLAGAQQGGLVHLEVDVHRVDRNDRGEEGLVLVDQVALGEIIAADLPVDRRDDPGEFVIQPGDLHGLLHGLHPRVGLVDDGLLLVELLLADRAG